MNKLINQEIGQALLVSYKRASNILDHELKNQELELSNAVDPALFKNDFEKRIFIKHPKLQSIKEQLYKEGAIYAAMSGSGSTIYGFFEK